MNEGLKDKLAELESRFGHLVSINTEKSEEYSKDASEISVPPLAVAFPENENEVVEIINFCRLKLIPIVFRGAGTGYSGGAVPVSRGIVLSLEKLKKLEIIPEKKMALCGPGVITIDLMNEAKKQGLFYPPDPASYDESTLGGNVAECAGGLHCKRFGVTRDYVIGLKNITANGELLKSGYFTDKGLFNLESVLIGSEGLLTAVTEIALRLVDMPKFGPTMLAAFDNPENAARSVSEITRKGIIPSVMEYMDGDAVAASNAYERSVDINNAEAILLFETAGNYFEEDAVAIEEICNNNKAIYFNRENDPKKAEKLWRIRRNLSKAVKASAKAKIAEDVCVPPSRLPELVAFVAQLNGEYPIRVNSYGHAGDGNLHVNFLSETGDEQEAEIIEDGIDRVFRKTLELGGTITGEHGIGLTKKDYIHLEFDTETIEAMKMVKEVFDPDVLFNPGKMFS